MQRAIFYRLVLWSAVCRGCVRGFIQSESGIYYDVLLSNVILCNLSIALEVEKSEENERAKGDKRWSN